MSLHIDFEGVWDVHTKVLVESTVRECIGDPPEGAEWSVWVSSFGSYCTVLVKATQQTRRKVFLLRAAELSEAIPGWLKAYPLH